MGVVVWLLTALLFMPLGMLPRAVTTAPSAPAQNPSEEESHSSHSVAAHLQQLVTTAGSRTWLIASSRSRFLAKPKLKLGASQGVLSVSLVKEEIARRNGCGGPLRC